MISEFSKQLKTMLETTLSWGVQKLGPMPDDCGDKVRKILASDDQAALLALGCSLDDCIKEHGNWNNLKDLLDKIPEDRI